MRPTRIAHYRLRVRCRVFAPDNTNLSSASCPEHRPAPRRAEGFVEPLDTDRLQSRTAYRSRTAGPRAITRISRPVSGPLAISAPRSGAAPRHSQSPRITPYSSLTTPAARSGGFPATRAHPPSTPPHRRRRPPREKDPGRAAATGQVAEGSAHQDASFGSWCGHHRHTIRAAHHVVVLGGGQFLRLVRPWLSTRKIGDPGIAARDRMSGPKGVFDGNRPGP